MKAADKRIIAERCRPFALIGDYKRASMIRQEAYAKDPPATIGIDWNNFSQVWRFDARYIAAMRAEPFDDLHNTDDYINALKAGLFIDELFGFRDFYGVKSALRDISETINCPALDCFLERMRWPRTNKVFIYCDTKKKNITARIYYASATVLTNYVPPSFPAGEYDLGFWPGTPEHIIDARRRWLENYALFEDMAAANIPGFPKTFRTFEKHQQAEDEKYKLWISQYEALKK